MTVLETAKGKFVTEMLTLCILCFVDLIGDIYEKLPIVFFSREEYIYSNYVM